jgi:glycosyltransferase involved in cell wall biosynthesis
MDGVRADGPGREGAGLGEGAGPGEGAGLGVVIPALDEEDTLPRLLEDLARMRIGHRILVVDGGSADGTVAAARAGGAEVMRSRAGRARQMNAGAALLTTRWLLFLHADSRLDDSALDSIARHVRRDAPRAGYFRLAIAHKDRY